MKRWLLVISLIILTLGLSFFSLSAEIDPNTDNLASMAGYYPSDTLFFAATRIDEAYINELDDLLSVITEPLAQFGIPPIGITQALTLGTGFDANAILDWLGGTAAVGIPKVVQETSFGTELLPTEFYVVISLADREMALTFLDENLVGFERIEADGIVQYRNPALYVQVTQEVMVFSAVPFLPVLAPSESLLDTQSYQDALFELPLDNYNILMYLDMPTLVDAQLQISQVPPNVVKTNISGLAIGFGKIDQTNLVIDLVQLPEDPFMYDGIGQVSREFLQRIPAQASAFMQVSDYTNVYHSFTQFMDDLAVSFNEPMIPSEEFSNQFAQIGINLEADILSWVTGDFVTFSHIDALPIVQDALAYELELNNRFAWGIAMDTTANPEAASRLVSKLTDLMQQAQPSDEIALRTETIAGVEATILEIDAQIQNPFVQVGCNEIPPVEVVSFEILLASNDEVFVFATRPLADAILSGDVQSIADTPSYQQASQYFLPDPTSVWFTTGEGFLYSTALNPIGILTLLGPQIGCVFENILTTFTTPSADATPTPTPTPPPTPTPNFEEINSAVSVLEYAIQTIQSSSITSTITQNGTIKVRAVLSYQAN